MSVRNAPMRDGKYIGNLTDKQIKIIEQVRKLEVIPGLKNIIYDYPPELVDKAYNEGQAIEIEGEEEEEEEEKPRGELTDVQTVGVGFMYFSKHSLLGDGTGTGKTVQLSGLINLLERKKELTRALIVTDNTAGQQIAKKIIRFTGLCTIDLAGLTGKKLEKKLNSTDWDKVKCVIIQHSQVTNDLLANWLAQYTEANGKSSFYNTFVFDESSAIKNVKTNIASYTREYSRQADRVHILNATPIETGLKDIYTQLDLMYEKLLPRWWRIEEKYCRVGNKSYWITQKGIRIQKFTREIIGYKNTEEFSKSIELFYLARGLKKADRAEYKVYTIEPTVDQLLAINRGNNANIVLNCPSLLEEIGIPTKRETVPKLDFLLTMVETEYKEESIYIYCFNKDAQYELYRELSEVGINVKVLNGETISEERQQIIEQFNSGEIRVLISNIKRSLDLAGGDICIYYTVLGNPANVEQIKGRIDRHTDDRVKKFIALVYKGTVEEKLFNKSVLRSEWAQELTNTEKTATNYLAEALEEDKSKGEVISI